MRASMNTDHAHMRFHAYTCAQTSPKFGITRDPYKNKRALVHLFVIYKRTQAYAHTCRQASTCMEL